MYEIFGTQIEQSLKFVNMILKINFVVMVTMDTPSNNENISFCGLNCSNSHEIHLVNESH